MNLGRVMVMALLLGTSTLAVPEDEAQGVDQTEEELDEVMVLGQRPVRNRDYISVWLRRLAGRFRNQGKLEFGPGSAAVPVSGVTDCVGVGKSPGVNCVIVLQAPGVETHLNPGSFLLGMDLETPTIRYTSVDDTGVAVGTTGELRGDTAVFRTPCVSSSARVCMSTTRITAVRSAASIRFQVEIQMDGRVTSRYDIEQVRVPQDASN